MICRRNSIACIFLICIAFFVQACFQENKGKQNASQPAAEKAAVKPYNANNTVSNLPFRVSALHAFSEKNRPDTFRLLLAGTSIVQGNVNFKIITAEGQLIFTDNFPATDLVGDLSLPADKQKEDTILSRMRSFFGLGNFATPAIGKNEKFDADNSKLDVWQDIRADDTATGFFYSHGY